MTAPWQTVEEDGTRFIECAASRSWILEPRDATLVLEACLAVPTRLALLYSSNLPARFFDVSSREAGEILQKWRAYGLRAAVVRDAAPHGRAAASTNSSKPSVALVSSTCSTTARLPWPGSSRARAADLHLMPDSVDVEQYLERIGLRGPVRPDLETLNHILFAHATSVPFENLDVLLGRPIELTPDALFRKIVVQRRGGYCFEQNGLLLHLLRTIGFSVTPLSARVRYQRPRDYIPPRTHLFLRVEIDEVPWVADCGVGSMSLTGAFRFDLEGEQATPHEPRRIIRENGVFFHQVRLGDAWHDVLEFTGEEMHPIDRELANWY
ncbi:MAG: DUF4180 domain-containing protein [Vicinamibacterales bacterium]